MMRIQRCGAVHMLDDERDVADGDDAVVVHVAEMEVRCRLRVKGRKGQRRKKNAGWRVGTAWREPAE